MPVFGVLPPIYKKDVILNMKYEYYPKRRTEQERRELNEQILRLLQSEACEQAGVTDEDIFNRYTCMGCGAATMKTTTHSARRKRNWKTASFSHRRPSAK